MKPTVRTVAALADVSKSTAALALKNDHRISEATRAKVHAAAERVGYQLNPVVGKLMAQLRVGRAARYRATLALLNGSEQRDLRQTPGSHRARLTEGIVARARELGYEIQQFRLRDPELNGARLHRIFRARGIEGAVVVSPRDHLGLPAEFDELWSRYPVISAGRRVLDPPISCAANDQYATMLMAVRETRALGRRRLGLVMNRDERLEHRFTAGFWAGHIDVPPRRWLPVLDLKADPDGLPDWLRTHRPDAILTYDPCLPDLLRRAGLRPFQDVTLVHVDWTPALKGWYGADQRTEELGAVAIEMLIGQIQRHEMGPPRLQRFSLVESRWVAPSDADRLANS